MARILKYIFEITDKPQTFKIPQGAEVVFTGNKGHTLCIWVETNQDEKVLIDRTFIVVGTGHIIPNNTFYIGTVIMEPFVWHVYEVM